MSSADPNRIQFRPGRVLAGRLADRAQQWAISENECGRRLAVLADLELTIADYPRIVELAAGMPFGEAARYFSWSQDHA